MKSFDFTLQSEQKVRLQVLVHQANLSRLLLLQQQLHQPHSQESAGSRHHTHVAAQGHLSRDQDTKSAAGDLPKRRF